MPHVAGHMSLTMYGFTCKKCRRLGYKVCDSAKCGLVRKPYPPGQHGKNRPRRPSEYGGQLLEKQKLKLIYGLREKQFKKYFDAAAGKLGVTHLVMLEMLERRLDNVVFRLGLAPGRRAARQMVSHGHFTVNGRRVYSPSYSVKAGDQIEIRLASQTNKNFGETRTILKKFQPPAWLDLDKEKLSARVAGLPDAGFLAEVPVEMAKVLEFYSR